MASAKDVFEAIQTAWNAANFHTSYSPLYRDMKAYNRAMVYAILSVEDVSRAARTCSTEYWQHVVRITLRGSTKEIVESALDTIGTAADAWSLSLASGTQVQLERTGEGYFQEDERVEVAFLQYRIVRSKGRLN